MNKTTGVIVLVIVVLFAGLFYFAPGGGSPSATTALTAEDWVRGAADAKVTIIEYGDFQCPACGAYEPLYQQALKEYKDTLQFAYRQFPLMQIHPNALPSARASEAAGKQGKFWEMHDMLYAKQSEWSTLANPKETFTGYAKMLKLDTTRFAADYDSKETENAIQADLQGGLKLGVNATPTIYVNGKKIGNPRDYNELKQIIEDAAKGPVSQGGGGHAYHAHANFKIYVNGTAVDVSNARFQSTEKKKLDKYAHLHGGDGETVHFHKEDITFRYFLSTLQMVLTADCFGLDTGERYCTGDDKTLRLYVNGTRISDIFNYQPKDLDKILLTFGALPEEEVARELTSVADTACIYSEKCPERGKPPKEECVGGLGTECKE